VADASMGRGDCRVDAGDRGLLSDLGSRVAVLRQDLLRSLGDAGHES
jgi:hypothetical protein